MRTWRLLLKVDTPRESFEEFKQSPIQLEWVAVKELTIKTARRGTPKIKVDSGHFRLQNGRSPFIREESAILITLSAALGDESFEEGESPFFLFAELVGRFKIDTTRFADSMIEKWADNIAPLIIYPYLREQVYGLTQRAGFSSVVLPLLEIPTLKQVDIAYAAEKASEELASKEVSAP